MRLPTTRVPLTASAKQANALLRENPSGMTQEQAQDLLNRVAACLVEHDSDPSHVVKDLGHMKVLTTAASKRSKALGWHVYYCQQRLRSLADPTYTVPGYTGRNSNRR